MKKLLVLFAALALFAAACGGGGDDDESSSSDSGGGGSAEDWCNFDEAREALSGELDEDDLFSPDGAEEVFTRFRDLTDDLENAAPEEIKDDVAVMADAFNSFIDDLEDADWDFLSLTEAQVAALDTPEVTQAQANMDAYTDENCGTSSSTDDSDSDTGDEPADEPTDEPADEPEAEDDSESQLDPDSDDTLRRVFVESFMQIGMTEDQASCVLDELNLETFAEESFNPFEFLDLFDECGIDPNQLQ